jgi:hypothetical protein
MKDIIICVTEEGAELMLNPNFFEITQDIIHVECWASKP